MLPTGVSPEGIVLVVEDEDAVRRITARILIQAGFRVLEAADAVEALALLDQLGARVVWLVLSDMLMPGMTGEELARTIARKWPGIQIVLFSAHAGPPTGFTGPFLQKPFQPEALVAAVTALLPSAQSPVG